MRLLGLIELFFMLIHENRLQVQTQSLFSLPSKTLLCQSHLIEKKWKQRSAFLPLAQEGCWHNFLIFLWIFFLRKTVFTSRAGIHHIITHKILRLSLTLQIIFCNGMFLFHFWPTHYFSLVRAIDAPLRKMHLCPHRTWRLTFRGIMDLHPQTAILGAHEHQAKNP